MMTPKELREGMLTILFVVMLGVCGYTGFVAVGIEQLNADANFYLPRKDRQADGTLADGKWRSSMTDSPNNRLRAMVQSYGLAQYVVAPMLFGFGMIQFANSKSAGIRTGSVVCAVTALAAFFLAVYRGYFSSLG